MATSLAVVVDEAEEWRYRKLRASSIDLDTIQLHWSQLFSKGPVKNGVRKPPTAAKSLPQRLQPYFQH
jgi:hypothetical protein